MSSKIFCGKARIISRKDYHIGQVPDQKRWVEHSVSTIQHIENGRKRPVLGSFPTFIKLTILYTLHISKKKYDIIDQSGGGGERMKLIIKVH